MHLLTYYLKFIFLAYQSIFVHLVIAVDVRPNERSARYTAVTSNISTRVELSVT